MYPYNLVLLALAASTLSRAAPMRAVKDLDGDPTVPEKREIIPAPSNAPPSVLRRFAKDSSFGLSAAGSAAPSAMPGGNIATEARGLDGQADAGLEGRALGDLDLDKRGIWSKLAKSIIASIASGVGSKKNSQQSRGFKKVYYVHDLHHPNKLLPIKQLHKRDVAPEDATGMLQLFGRALDELD